MRKKILTKKSRNLTKKLIAPAQLKYVFKLFITGNTPNSTRAIVNIKRICENFFKGQYELVVIDIYQNPQKASEEQIIAAPTLVKLSPSPVKKLVGDLSHEEKVLLALDCFIPQRAIQEL